MSDFSTANSEGDRAKRPIRGRVAVAANGRHPWKNGALLSRDHMDDPLGRIT